MESVPYGFGRDVSALGIPLNSARTRFAWLAGVCQGVDRVELDGESVREFEAAPEVLGGHTITVVRFNASQDGDVRIFGRGLVDPESGELITNPGRIIRLIYQLVERPASDALDLFTSEAATRSLEVRGVFDPELSGRQTIESIMGSVGALWADSSPSFAAFYPDDETEAREARGRMDPDYTASYRLETIATQLRLLFAFSAAEGRHLGVVVARAPQAIERHGSRFLEIDARWIPSTGQAVNLASRLLADRARGAWQITGRVDGLVYPGDTVEVPGEFAGTFVVVGAILDPNADTTTVTVRAPATDPATVQIVSVSEAFTEELQTPTIRETTEGAEFTIQDEDGNALPETSVTLDGTTTRQTDAAGVVFFPAHLLTPGPHELVAEKDGRSLVFGFTI